MKTILPKGVFEQHIIALGKTRSGKSSAMRYLVEGLLDDDKPVCIVDPKGDWWGLKSSADGKSKGYALVIFGGEHADVPLNARSGGAVAELIATSNRSCIIDLGGWMPSERTQFWIDFASTFFRLHRGQHCLVLDEVHNFCPKGKVFDVNAGKMLHWSNRLASEGLGKGISIIAASQRPQKVHNDFLTSCETLLAFRVIHAADRGAIADWIEGCGDEKSGAEVLRTMAQLQRGEAWAWSPEVEFGPSRIQFPMFSTYDSFRARGSDLAKLKGWAEVDLAEVTKKLDAAVKEAEASDPKKLKARIAELERAASSKTKLQPSAAVSKTAPRKLTDKDLAAALQPIIDEHTKKVGEWIESFKTNLETGLARSFEKSPKPVAIDWRIALSKAATKLNNGAGSTGPASYGIDGAGKAAITRTGANSHEIKDRSIPSSKPIDGSKVGAGALRVMQALKQFYPRKLKRETIVVTAGVTARSLKDYLSILRRGGYILDRGELIEATDKGLALAGDDYDTPSTTEARVEFWSKKLGAGAGRVLTFLVDQHPGEFTREQIVENAGVTTRSLKDYLSLLRRAMLIDESGDGTKAAESLFE